MLAPPPFHSHCRSHTLGAHLGAVGGPLEAADLLLMAAQRGGDVLTHTHIVVQDERVATASGQGVVVPRQAADAGSVATQVAHRLAALSIPDLGEGAGVTHCQVLAISGP